MNRRGLSIVDLGRRPYAPVLALQRAIVRARLDGAPIGDLLLLVEHEPVVTMGRGTRPGSLPLSPERLSRLGYDVAEVERGGDVTLHAPGQLVGYPIVDLAPLRPDLHWYLRTLEELLMGALDDVGIYAARNPGLTGVWVGQRKIASIGVHVKRWITLHGFALNVTTDLVRFGVIVPCGIAGVAMTSVEREAPALANPWGACREAVVARAAECFRAAPRALAPSELGELLPATVPVP